MAHPVIRLVQQAGPLLTGCMSADRVAKHVLVVDDYPDMAEILAELLITSSPMRITTDTGTDGGQAVALALSSRPAAAVLDIDMPVLDGVDAALAIRAALPDAPPLLIAMTGNPAHSAQMRTHLAFDHVLTKPVEVEVLLDLLATNPAGRR